MYADEFSAYVDLVGITIILADSPVDESTIFRTQILEKLGITPDRLAKARADVAAHRTNLKKAKLAARTKK